jgi:hypothetical protein
MKYVLVSLCALTLTACYQESIKLPQGYEYFHISPSIAAISDREHRVVVDPNVVEYAVTGDYVLGKRADARLTSRFSSRLWIFHSGHASPQIDRGAEPNGV